MNENNGILLFYYKKDTQLSNIITGKLEGVGGNQRYLIEALHVNKNSKTEI